MLMAGLDGIDGPDAGAPADYDLEEEHAEIPQVPGRSTRRSMRPRRTTSS
jgi:hypothetical protein